MPTSEATELHLPCKRHKRMGTLQAVEVRVARALAEYELTGDPTYQASACCSVCGEPSYYTYNEILNFMPVAWRPQPLPESHGWTLLLIEVPAAEHLTERYLFGERLLVQFEFNDNEYWYGTLRSPSGMAPSMPLGSRIGGNYLSGTPIVTTWFPEGHSKTIPVEWPAPGTQDIGSFFIPKDAPDTLLTANLICSNPSCGRFFSYNYSQLNQVLDEQATIGLVSHVKRILTITCPKCQTARVVDEACINSLYKL